MKAVGKISAALASIGALTTMFAVLAATPAAASPMNSPISRTACDQSNDFNYFTFFTGGYPVCFEGEGTLPMHFGPVSIWYAENNQGSFTYLLPGLCPPPVIFNPHETGTLPPDATIISLTILYGS
ncbi:hypothetical protein [Fodinicola feengrottensis]|uniref:Uncharacterized protein n=1 Tax=Fodinicola feengrottensis TaxID=435914 RepID=A0ABP4TJR9_9ACTN|nr:hypothetical protein [Fodinicola feengrottensis]